MRTYGGRFLKNSVQRQVAARMESRDALLVSIDYVARKALVKIQGSSAMVVAHFPENMASAEAWLKPGNAVRISHTGGERGRIELMGHGATIPTLLPGDTTTITPTIPDAVISGLMVIATGGMVVAVTTGSVRFDGTTTAIGEITLAESSVLPMNTEAYLGEIAAAFTVPTAPAAGLFRFDIVVIGPDLMFDYVTGAAAATPVMPFVPADHLYCGHVLVAGAVTSITSGVVNASFATPAPVALTMTIADTDFAWEELSTTVTLTVIDQFGNPCAFGGGYFVLTISHGNGIISGWGQSSTFGVSVRTTGPAVAFTYTRDQGYAWPADVSPTLHGYIGDTNLSAIGSIILRDENGDIQ